MHLDETELVATPGLQDYVADALEAVRVKFVNDASKIDSVKSYPIEFAYQQFGDSEKIVGYKNLRVTFIYSDVSMFSYLKIEHDGLMTSANKDIEPDNIRKKVLQLYPIDQQECLVETPEAFQEACQRQCDFKPFGEEVSDFSFGNRNFQLYKVMENSPEFDSYMCRIQTLTMWFIEGAQYTDNNDPRFMHYLLYEVSEDSTTNPIKLAGYMTLYRFYAHPNLERVRFSHVLILPPYRSMGLGPKFLGTIFEDIRRSDKIVDATAEEPAESFMFMRDYVDVIACKLLPEFSLENLRKGFNKEKTEQARKRLKICKQQFRRVFELLYYYYVMTECSEDKEKFKSQLRKRLEAPFKQSKRDSSKIHNALDQQELAVLASNTEDREQRIQEMLDYTLECYGTVITRLMKYEPTFQK